MKFDLLTLRPIEVSEAKPRDVLNLALQRLRSSDKWVSEGLPRRDVLAEVDPEFINHAEHLDKMLSGGVRPDGSSFRGSGGIKSVELDVSEATADVTIKGSLEWDKRPHAYITRIQFQNFKLISGLSEHTWSERARVLLGDNVRVDCDCAAFRYFHRHAATTKGFALIPESRPARVRNPHGRGGVCKHLEHALKYLGGSYTKLASAMKLSAKQGDGLSEKAPVLVRLSRRIEEARGPRVLYRAQDHGGTSYDETKTKDFGIHAGTEKAARERASALGSHAQIHKVHVSVHNPIRMKDNGAWSSVDIASHLHRTGKMSTAKLHKIGRADEPTGREMVTRHLEKLGHDGIVYRNKVEGAGTDSVIALRGHQVKHAGMVESTALDARFQRDKAKVDAIINDASLPDRAVDGKAYVILWAGGRGVWATRSKASLRKWIEEVGDAAELVSIKYTEPVFGKERKPLRVKEGILTYAEVYAAAQRHHVREWELALMRALGQVAPEDQKAAV